MNQVFYWESVIVDPTIFDKAEYQVVIDSLRMGNYAEAALDLKQLKGHRIYSARVNQSDRLLFTTIEISNKRHLLFLEVIANHDYQKSKFLKPGVLSNYLDKNAELIDVQINEKNFHQLEEANHDNLLIEKNPSTSNYKYTSVEYYKNKFIMLNKEQQEALINASLNKKMLIGGPPGSGKSSLSLYIISRYIDQLKHEYLIRHHTDQLIQEIKKSNDKKILYVTRSLPLAATMQKIWKDLPQSTLFPAETVQFKTYMMIAKSDPAMQGKNIVNEREPSDDVAQLNSSHQLDDFNQWISTYIKHQKDEIKAQQKNVKNKNAKNTLPSEEFFNKENYYFIYLAFRILSYTTGGEGKKSLPFTKDEELKWAEKALNAYRLYLEKNNKVDLSFLQLTALPTYDLIVVDEAQDFSHLQLILLSNMAKDGKICFAMDSHQSLFDLKSIQPFLKQAFTDIVVIPLSASYRCPNNVIQLANKVIKVKHQLVGGTADNLTYLDIPQQETSHPGELIWADDKSSNDLMDKIKERSNQPDFAIITLPEFVQEAKEKFPSATVFVVEKIKGLEYDTILAYRLLDDKRFAQANTLYKNTSKEEKTHRPKAGKGDETFAPLFNQLFTAFTRTSRSLIIYQKDTREIRELMNAFRETDNKKNITCSPKLEQQEKTNWDADIVKLIEVGLIKDANRIIEQHCNGKISKEVQIALENYQRMKNEEALPAPAYSNNVNKTSINNNNAPAIRGKTSSASSSSHKMTNQNQSLSPKDKFSSQDYVIKTNKNYTPEYFVDLLKKGIDPKIIVNSEGNTLLHLAIMYLKVDAVDELIQKGMPLDKKNNKGESPLDILNQLEKNTNNNNDLDKIISIKSSLVAAIVKKRKQNILNSKWNNNIEKLKKAIKTDLKPEEYKNGIFNEQNLKMEHGETLLVVAVCEGYLNLVEALIESGAPFDTPIENHMPIQNYMHKGYLPLHLAIVKNNIKMVDILLAAKTETVNKKTNQGFTPLSLAARHGKIDMAKRLIEAGADINISDSTTLITPLGIAIQNGHSDLALELIKIGAKNIKMTDKNDTPLHIAAQYGNGEVINKLIEIGADVNAQNKDGNSPLHIATVEKHFDVIKALIDAKANVNCIGDKGATALDLALLSKNMEIASVLTDAGALMAQEIQKQNPIKQDRILRDATSITLFGERYEKMSDLPPTDLSNPTP